MNAILTSELGPGVKLVDRYFSLIFLLFVVLVAGSVQLLTVRISVPVGASGIVRPAVVTPIRPSVPGLVTDIHVSHNDFVRPGDTLIILANHQMVQDLHQTLQELRVKTAEIDEFRTAIDNQIQIGEAEVNGAENRYRLATLEHEHLRDKLGRELRVANSTTDARELNLVQIKLSAQEAAKADFDKATYELEAVSDRSLELLTLGAERRLLALRATYLEGLVKRLIVLSPAEGRITTRDLHLLRGSSVSEGETLLEVSDPNWFAVVGVTEIDIPYIEKGQIARVFINAFNYIEYRDFKGIVEEIGRTPTGSAENAQTLYPVKIRLQLSEANSIADRFYPEFGMTAEAKVIVERATGFELVKRGLAIDIDPAVREVEALRSNQ